MYNNYEAMETLRYALFCAGPTSAMAAARTASDDSTDHGDQEECFQKDYQQFLDASSDDCQVGCQRLPQVCPLGLPWDPVASHAHLHEQMNTTLLLIKLGGGTGSRG